MTDGVDFISSLPDAIIHIIFSSFPTKFFITTSVLSKRWRHIWCTTPFLSIHYRASHANLINQTLTRYSAPKITTFHLCISDVSSSSTLEINRLIAFAMFRNVDNLSLDFRVDDYCFPDFFYTNASLLQLSIDSANIDLTHRSSNVLWTSLSHLSLSFCKFSDESLAKILSNSPLLESLTLRYCDNLKLLDLRKSVQLRRLDIENQGNLRIVAPFIRSLRLKYSLFDSDLIDVSSLREANLNMLCSKFNYFSNTVEAEVLQVVIVKMLKMLQNVEILTFGAIFLQVLSLAEISGLPFPMLEVKVLKFETMMVPSVIPGIAKLLQRSPELEKIKLHIVDCNIIHDLYLNRCLYGKGLDSEQCWKQKDYVFPDSSEPEVMTLVMKFLQEHIGYNGYTDGRSLQYNWFSQIS